MEMSSEKGLIFAYVLDGQGGGRSVDWNDISNWQASAGVLWVHLDRTDHDARQWLRDSCGLHPAIANALLAKESRPRSMVVDQDLLVCLRGINLNPGEDPEDMVAIRMFVTAERVISVRRRKLVSVEDLRSALADGNGPTDSSEVLVMIAEALTDHMDPELTEINDELDRLEKQLEVSGYSPARGKLGRLQRDTISLRRYLDPQRDALAYLCKQQIEWLKGGDRLHLYEIIDQVTRYVESLNSSRERAEVLRQQISNALSRRTSRNMYVLSIIAGIFLPLDFLTGLWGVNLSDTPQLGFPAFAIGLIVLASSMALFFVRSKWLRPIRHLDTR
jgi:zinc transporter